MCNPVFIFKSQWGGNTAAACFNAAAVTRYGQNVR